MDPTGNSGSSRTRRNGRATAAESILDSLLFTSGLIGIVVGCGMVLIPAQFHATAGIVLGPDINLLNEMRASGGAVLGAGGLVFLGAFVSRLRFTATVIGATLYLSYGLSRLLSIVLDGTPGPTLQVVTGLEIVIGSLCAVALLIAGSSRAREGAQAAR